MRRKYKSKNQHLWILRPQKTRKDSIFAQKDQITITLSTGACVVRVLKIFIWCSINSSKES